MPELIFWKARVNQKASISAGLNPGFLKHLHRQCSGCGTAVELASHHLVLMSLIPDRYRTFFLFFPFQLDFLRNQILKADFWLCCPKRKKFNEHKLVKTLHPYHLSHHLPGLRWCWIRSRSCPSRGSCPSRRGWPRSCWRTWTGPPPTRTCSRPSGEFSEAGVVA